MKILQINTTLNWGSTGRIAEEIGLLLQDKGFESYIAYGRYNNPSRSKTYQIGNKFDVYFHGLLTRIFDNHGLGSKNATLKLVNYIKEIQPDIIHLHNIHGYYVNYQILFNLLSKLDIPIVWTLHDCWSFTGHCSHFSYENCERWKTICYNCPQQRNYPGSFIMDRSKQNYIDKKKAFTSIKNLTIVTVSKWLENEVKSSFLKNFPIKTIYNGINLETFKPTPSLEKNKEFNNKFVILGLASVWTERKGFNDFKKLRSLLSTDYIIILIGLSKKQIKELPEGIIGIQRTNSIQELAEYYSLANVFFNPTWEDNFPTTNLEALACGTPVITYKTGGSIEAIDEKTGFIVDQGDLNTTVQIIEKLKSVDKEKYKISCRQRAIQFYNKNERYEEYIKLYNSIL